MPRNSSGVYTLPAGNPVVPNTLIETTWANPTMSDLGSSLTDSLDRNGRGGMLAALKLIDGTVAAPALSFSSESTSGIYRSAANTLAIAIAGVLALSINATTMTVAKAATFSSTSTFTGAATFNGGASFPGGITGVLALALGAVGAPSLTYTGDLDTGMWSPGADTVAWSTGGAERARLTSAGHLGVGVTPSVRLHAKSASEILRIETTTARGSGNGFLALFDPTGRKGYLGYGGADDAFYLFNEMNAPMLFGTNNAERVRIDTSGNIGIGATPSAWGAAFKGLQLPHGALTTQSGAVYLHANNYSNGATDLYVANGYASRSYQFNGQHAWQVAPSGIAGNAITWNTAMLLDNSGKVGIGNTGPTSTVDVLGLQTNSSGTSANNPTGTLRLGYDGGDGAGAYGASVVFSQRWQNAAGQVATAQISGIKIGSTGNFGGGLAFWTSNGTGNDLAERMRIDSSGNVGIGGTPAVRFDVLQSASGEVVRVRNTSAGAGSSRVLNVTNMTDADLAIELSQVGAASKFAALNTSTLVDLRFIINGTERARLTSDGRLYGTALHNNAGSVTGTANQYIASGTYTPTLTNTGNITSSTPLQAQWIRVGNVVSVSGQATVTPTTTASIVLGVSLPIASNLTASENLEGTGALGAGAVSCSATGDAANDRATISGTPTSSGSSQTLHFHFQYLIQ